MRSSIQSLPRLPPLFGTEAWRIPQAYEHKGPRFRWQWEVGVFLTPLANSGHWRDRVSNQNDNKGLLREILNYYEFRLWLVGYLWNHTCRTLGLLNRVGSVHSLTPGSFKVKHFLDVPSLP